MYLNNEHLNNSQMVYSLPVIDLINFVTEE